MANNRHRRVARLRRSMSHKTQMAMRQRWTKAFDELAFAADKCKKGFGKFAKSVRN